MILYTVWCEYDMGFNDGGNKGVYSSEEERLKALESVDWSLAEFSSWEEALEEGLLELKEIEG